MPCHLRMWQTCEVLDCLRPARFYGLCTPCWSSLSAMERKVLTDCEHTEPLDTLELLYALPSWADPKRRAA